MAGKIDYLKDAKRFSVISEVFAFVAVALYIAFLVWFVGALFGDWSWWATLGFFLGGSFFRAQWREYRKESQKYLQEGIASGEIIVDANNVVQRATQ